MTSKLTRERIEQYANDPRMCNINDEIREMARMALAAMDSEPVAYADPQSFDNFKSNGGENAACTKEWMWRDHSAGLIPLYRHAQQPVVLDDGKLRELFDAWFASDCSFDLSPEASEADNIAWRESYWYVWKRCRAAMLQAGNSTVIPDGSEQRIAEAVELLKRAAPAMLSDDSGPNGPLVGRLKAQDVPGWIPVCERMPEKNQSVLISVNFDSSLVEPLICSARYTGSTFRRGEATVKPGDGIEQATHWMLLPAAPQPDK